LNLLPFHRFIDAIQNVNPNGDACHDDSLVKPHMERALRLGCTEQELLEALETALTPVGSPPFRQALSILMQVTGWEPAKALIKFLLTTAAARVIKAKGMEPG
jgi:hypothetical protein